MPPPHKLSNVTTFYCRSNSIFISLQVFINEYGESGIETLALTPQGAKSSSGVNDGDVAVALSGNKLDSWNVALATAVHAPAAHYFAKFANDLGVKRARLDVLKGLIIPGIQTNIRLSGAWTQKDTEGLKHKLAETICGGVLNYNKAREIPKK